MFVFEEDARLPAFSGDARKIHTVHTQRLHTERIHTEKLIRSEFIRRKKLYSLLNRIPFGEELLGEELLKEAAL